MVVTYATIGADATLAECAGSLTGGFTDDAPPPDAPDRAGHARSADT